MSNEQRSPRGRRQNNPPVVNRIRMGLVMRKGMDFGALGDVETILRMQGVSLAPMSTGEASLMLSGVAVMATATADDITHGRVKGLIIPGGPADEAGDAQTRALIVLAREKGLPVLSFGEGVALSAEVSGQAVEGDGAVFSTTGAVAINDRDALVKAVDIIAA